MIENDVTEVVNWCSMFCYGNRAVGEISAPGMPNIPVCEGCLEKLMKDPDLMKSILPEGSQEVRAKEADLLDRLKRIASS